MVRVEDRRAGTPGTIPPPPKKFLFSFKIQETCTLTTFVEQKSLCVKKIRNFMNRKRAV